MATRSNITPIKLINIDCPFIHSLDRAYETFSIN